MEVTAIYFCFGQHLLVHFKATLCRHSWECSPNVSTAISQVWQLTKGKVIAHHHQAGQMASHPFIPANNYVYAIKRSHT